ncbi:hypothetical protein MFIFM68171_02962 [Madurella fahalii]|uniref:Prolyl 4-hydroxylase alpha subunit domain-containing protein n=1 Tax=Madurella fahalii TaxID=1157608 RepID=A0ABQ0G4T0_9PEZI
MAGPLQLLTISATVALSAYFGPLLLGLLIPTLQTHLPFPIFSTPPPPSEPCPPHAYTTQLISLDPLLILIRNFIPPAERAAIIAAGTPLLVPSPINEAAGSTDAGNTQFRTSHSAPLPGTDAAVACVLARAGGFAGTLLAPARDDVGPAQMVRYTPGQKFDLHHDWFRRPRITDADAAAGRRRLYNRVATFFAVLGVENVTEGSGETWFPHVRAIESQVGGGGNQRAEEEEEKGEQAWREHEDGGLAFQPVPGNALFWVNLMANGTGDARTLHAGLPVAGGVKYGMNIWPRRFFGPDA